MKRKTKRRELAIQINRRENESPLSFHKRLVYGKLVDGTLADADYTELAKLVYGRPYAPDVARRMLYGSRRTLELMDSERRSKISDQSVLSEIDEKINELKKAERKFYDQRREYTKLLTNEGRTEHLFDFLIPAAERLNQTVGCMYAVDRTGADISDVGYNEAVLILTDWHYGLKTDNIFNYYDTEVCKQRVRTVIDEAIRRIRLHRCGKLHVVVLGDLMHGAIHVSARVASEELVCDQLMQVAEVLAQSILALSSCVEETKVYMTYGNHGRTVQNKNDSIHRDNMERLIPWWLRQRLMHQPTISVEEESKNEFVFVKAAGHDICATHGDLDSVTASPRLIPALAKRTGRSVEYIIHGDKHHPEMKEELGVTARICGSLCGTDDHANGKRLYSTPSQFLLIVDPEYGPDAEYNLRCE